MKRKWLGAGAPFFALSIFFGLFALLNTGIGVSPAAAVADPVWEAVAQEGEARVLVQLRATGRAPAAEAMHLGQQAVLDSLAPEQFQLRHRYEAVPGFSGRVTPQGLALLQKDPRVVAVVLDEPGGGHLADVLPAIGADVVHRDHQLTGAGVTVAVLDTGVDTDHPDLQDDLMAQHCFTDGSCPPYGSYEGYLAEDEHGHGTNVAGIITGRGLVAPVGVAPDAGLVAVRVLDENNSGWVSDWVAGLDWLIAHQGQLGIGLVNLSLGTWALYPGNCDAQQPLLAAAVARLNGLGVVVAASSGNQGNPGAIAAPACNTGVIAVGATYDRNLWREPDEGTYKEWQGGNWPDCYDAQTDLATIACFGNSSPMLDVVAPGSKIVAAGRFGSRSIFVGTSQATAVTTGVAALMRQVQADLAPVAIELLLENSGQLVSDPRTGGQVPRINALGAVQALLPVAPTLSAIQGVRLGATGVTHTFTATVQPLGSDLPLEYTWEAAEQKVVAHSRESLADTASFAWPVPGVYPITVTVANAGGVITATHLITVDDVALLGVSIIGPRQGGSGAPQPFVATAAPLTVSLPITYSWLPGGLPGFSRQLSLAGDAAVFSWPEPGVYTIEVRASNVTGQGVSSHQIVIQDVVPVSLTITGPQQALAETNSLLVAAVTPLTVSQPLTYVWQVGERPAVVHEGGQQDSLLLRWDEAGSQTITVAAHNSFGVVTATHSLTVTAGFRSYMPSVQQNRR